MADKKTGFLLLDTLVGLSLGCVILLVLLACIVDGYKMLSESTVSLQKHGEFILLDQTIRRDIERGDGFFEAGNNYFIIGNVRYEVIEGKITRIAGTEKRVVGEKGYSFESFSSDGKQFLKITKIDVIDVKGETSIVYKISFIST